MQRIQPLGAPNYFGRNPVLHQLAADCILHFGNKFFVDLLLREHFLLQFQKSYRLQITKCQVFELSADQPHS